MAASQEAVFEAVAKDAVDSVLSGYNSTVFSYGQTGKAGKERGEGEGEETLYV